MLNPTLIPFLFLIASLNTTQVQINNDVIAIIGDHPANMKTTNGCGAYAFFIGSRGDADVNISGSVGYITCYPDNHYEIVDTFPSEQLMDFIYPFFQMGLGEQDLRYFAALTNTQLYLFENYLTDPCLPSAQRFDSIIAPAGYIDAVMNDLQQMLVVSSTESSPEYLYTFYTIPELSVDSQFALPLKPYRIIAYPDWPGGSYLVCGNATGINQLTSIEADDLKISFSINLPPEATNTQEIFTTSNAYFLLSSPGDSASFLIKINKADTLISIFQLLNSSGINVSSIQTEFYSGFILQPLSGPLSEQLLLVDINQNSVTDTILLNKRLTGLHANDATGFGNDIYQLIMGTDDSSAIDSAYFSSSIFLSSSPHAIPAGAKPVWFAEDIRCYAAVSDIEENLSIQVYPNPTTDNVQIVVMHLASGKTYNFDITDINGKILWRQEIVAKEYYTVPFQEMPSGILILRVNTGTKMVTASIVKK